MDSEIMQLHLEGMGRERIAEYLGITVYQVRSTLARMKANEEFSRVEPPEVAGDTDIPLNSSEGELITVEFADGKKTYTAKNMELSDEELDDERAVMIRCRLDPDKWEVVSYRYSCHDGMAKLKTSENGPEVMEIKKLYGVRLVVKPKIKGFDIEKALERSPNLMPRVINPVKNTGDGLLELGITDAHFGLNTLEDYQETLDEIDELMRHKDTLVVLMGTDNIDVNGFSFQTIHGTQLEPVDLDKAYDECFIFFSTIIHNGLSRGMDVHVMYVPGNHDRDISWGMVKSMQKLYPQAHYDTSIEQYKAFRYGDVAIGWTHGDDGKAKDFDRIFMKDFPHIFGGADVFEIHSGHLHREGSGDVYGTMVRSLPSKTRRNKWADKKGYRSAQRFQCFEYKKDRIKSIHYV